MANRKKYVIKKDEINSLVSNIISNGTDDTYTKMCAKIFLAIDDKVDLDEMLMDMADETLEKARKESEKKNNEIITSAYYSLHFILRKLANQTYRKYIKKGIKKESTRFLNLITNESAPELLK
jgi:hypothetical protein